MDGFKEMCTIIKELQRLEEQQQVYLDNLAKSLEDAKFLLLQMEIEMMMIKEILELKNPTK